jgi:dihydrolipoamide dehydrogenase
LLRPVELYDQARPMPGVNEAVTGSLDADAVLKRRDWFVGADPGKPFGHDDAGQLSWLDGAGVASYAGTGGWPGPRRSR